MQDESSKAILLPSLHASMLKERAGRPLTDPEGDVSRTAMILLLLAVVVFGYIWSIPSGLWLDDHMHYAHLKHLDWSFDSAVKSAELGIVGEVMDLWGRHEGGLRFFRPIAFWVMKAEYTLTGWHPWVMHLFSILFHAANTLLVTALACRFLKNRMWAMLAGAIFALHPNHVGTVYWIACQTELLVTMLLLLAILAYARRADWRKMSFRIHLHPFGRPLEPDADELGRRARGRHLSGLVAVTLYALALGCRENALLFPVICWMGDRLCGSRKGWIRWEHVLMGIVAIGYLALRTQVLGGFPLPAKPYLMPLSDPQFFPYIIEKIVVYTLGLFAFLPVVPIGSQNYLAGKPIIFYGAFTALLIVGLIVWLAYRRPKSMLWPAVWMGCFLAPVLPVFSASHHLYLPSPGMAILFTAGLAMLGGAINPHLPRLLQVQRVAATLFITALFVCLGFLNWMAGFTFNRGILAEQLLINDVRERGPELQDGDHLFFINLPLTAYYAIPALKEQTGLKEIHGHTLIFATCLPRMKQPSTVEILDRHRLRVSAPEGEPYLEGITGHALLSAMGLTHLPQQGEIIEADMFTVVPTRVNERGIEELLFTFKQPLDSPNYHFYLGSPWFFAYPLDMERLTTEATER